MPKSVQFRPEPDFSTPPVVPRSAGFAAGDSSPGAAVDLRKLLERTPVQVRRSVSQSVAAMLGKAWANYSNQIRTSGLNCSTEFKVIQSVSK